MTSSSRPIALPTSPHSQDIAMGSYSGASLHPASYSKHLLGMPISWKAGSFGSRFYPAGSPGQLLGPLDPNDFKCGRISSSIESDRGQLLSGYHPYDRQDELCRDYTCCGRTLTDMHALVDHFEEVHVIPMHVPQSFSAYPSPHPASAVVPSQIAPSLAGALTAPNQSNPSYVPYHPQQGEVMSLNVHHLQPEPVSIPSYQSGPFDPDDMELDSDPALARRTPYQSPSPPDTPLTTPQSATAIAYPKALLPFPHYPSQPPSPHPHSHAGSRAITPDAGTVAAYPFNAYAKYSDYSSSMPGTVPSPPSHEDANGAVSIAGAVDEAGGSGNCVQPSALFSAQPPPKGASSRTQPSTPSASRPSSPSTVTRTSATRRQSTLSAPSTTLSRPASTLLLSKPFPCPKPNCNKSYKQANGLKYHITYGSCSLKPVREVEAVRVLLASKSAASGGSSGSASNSSPGSPTISQEGELFNADGVEVTQADLLLLEKRIRPFACGIGDCNRRYKNMNGLRYHYSTTGDHGRKGFELLAAGIHECLVNSDGSSKSRSGSRGGSRAQSRAQTPAPVGRQQQQNKTVPAFPSFESEITLRSPQQQYSSYQPQQTTYGATQPSTQVSPVVPTYTPFQTTSYTLAGAMGPAPVVKK